jgi:hypothetical protein
MCYNSVLSAALAAIGSSSRGKGAGDSPLETRKPGSRWPCGRRSRGRYGGQGSGPEKQLNDLFPEFLWGLWALPNCSGYG